VRRAPVIAAVAALAVAGCGGDDEPAGGTPEHGGVDTATATTPAGPPEEVVTAPEEAAPPATVTAPEPSATSPEDEPGGAGDEEGIRVPARFVLGSDGTMEPSSVEVPAFLGTEVVVENRDDASHRLEVGDRGTQLEAGRTTTLTLAGRRPGELPVLVDGSRVAVLRLVAETP